MLLLKILAQILNKGVKCCLLTNKTAVDDIIAGAETSITHLEDSSKFFIRETCKTCIGVNLRQHIQVVVTNEFKITKS